MLTNSTFGNTFASNENSFDEKILEEANDWLNANQKLFLQL